MSDLVIRPLVEPDLDQFMICLSALSPVLMSEKRCSQLVHRRVAQGISTYVAILDGKIVATGSLFIEQKMIHDGGQVGHIEDVAVRRDQQGKGLGKAIIEHLIKVAEEKGCYKVILDCSEENVGFYEACSFYRNGVSMRVDLW